MHIRDNSRVSVIIPTYNAEKTIESTLQSVLNQTWKNIEVIIVNDGSSDNTKNIISKYVDDPRINYIFQENKGCSNAKNTGLKAATGDFIQYLDADDILSLDKIEVQLDALKSNINAVAVCRTVKFKDIPIDLKEKEVDTDLLFSTNNPIEFLLNLYGANGKAGMIQPNAFMISRLLSDKVGKWDESISPSPDEDGEYFCRVMLASSAIIYTSIPVNFYRIGINTSLSKQHSYIYCKGALHSIVKKKEHLLEYENSERVRRVIANKLSAFQYQYYNLYKDLINQADTELKEIGFYSKIPIVGGYKFKILGRLVGMKKALKIRYFLTNLKIF